jgi:hypothetical protein
MKGKHEPDNEFIEKLEWQIGHEVRRRNRTASEPSWLERLHAVPRLALAGLILASMSLGAGVVAAAYQAQGNERRDMLKAGFERRARLARERLALTKEQLQNMERRFSLGVGSREDVLDARFKIAEAEAQLKSIELEIEELRATGHEPLNAISSPLVSGRDFVTERMQIAASVPEAALELEKARLQEAEKRYSLGAAEAIEIDSARARLLEAEAAVEALRRRAAIRQQFLNRKLDGAAADLRELEAEAALRQKSLTSQLEVARKELQRAIKKVELGTGQKVQQAEAALKLQMLETDLAKSELDLELVRRQIQLRGGKE